MLIPGWKYVLLVFLFGFCSKASNLLFAQNYTLSNWTVEDGLSSNELTDIVQDKDGFIWIATEHGLNKFDGYTFQKLRYDPSDSTSIGANFINNICLDNQDNVWVNLGIGVLSKYDRLTQKFSNYTFEDRNTYIHDLKYIPDFGMSVATNKGFYIVDQPNKQLQPISFSNIDSSLSIYKVFPSACHGIYMSTNKGFKFWNQHSNSLDTTFFVEKSDTFALLAYIEKFHEDSKGHIWARAGSGYLIKSENGLFFKKSYPERLRANTYQKRELFISSIGKDSTVHFSKSGKLLIWDTATDSWLPFPNAPEDIGFIFQDNQSHLWIYTKADELFRQKKNSWELVLNLSDHFSDTQIPGVFVDKNNGIWFATKGSGLWRVYNRKWPVSTVKDQKTNKIVDFEITALVAGQEDFMWVGASQQLYKYFFESEELIPIFPNPKKNPIAGLAIHEIATNGNQLILGTSQGILLMDEEGLNYQHHKTFHLAGKEESFGFIRTVLYMPNDLVWIGTNRGLILYDLKSNSFERYGTMELAGKHLNGSDVHTFHAITDTSFLIGYIKSGADLVTFNPKDYSIRAQKITYKNALMEQVEYSTINTYYQDGSDYWVGCFSKGLLKLDLDNLSMSPLDEAFPIIPNVKGIQKGIDGKLWVSSIDGIRSVNPKDHTFYRFSKASGLLSNHFIRDCAVQDSRGNLYFASKNGLNKINPATWDNQDTIAKPILTAFKKYDKSVSFDKHINEIQTIMLTYQDDFITFEFVSPTYDNPYDVDYIYQLEGFDLNWHYCENQRSATYTNLAPGKYLFKIRAGNKGGFLNSATKEIQIIVTPPFWETSWFILLMLGLLIFAYWLAYKIQSQIRKSRLKTIAAIRQKAADDFHDELGHRLTKIGLFVESLMLQKDKFPPQSASILQKIQNNANELFHSTKDFIWAINPSKDSLMELFILLRDFGNELFDQTNIQFSAEGLKEAYKSHLLDMDLKRQLVLIFKEAMNNALKHSECSKVIFKIEAPNKQLIFSLTDNGRGFMMDREQFGYGLNSMLNRAKKIGGKLEINSREKEGTEIILKLLR